jgi:hypothetical protein
MSAYASKTTPQILAGLRAPWSEASARIRLERGTIFGLILAGALVAFELFNFSTTEFALKDLLGELSSGALPWATILALAFCGIDFAGLARLLTTQKAARARLEGWYLLGAWALGATMNATLTWWAVSLAMLRHDGLGNEVLGRESLLLGVPVFVALLVWLIRVLIIGTFSLAGGRIFSQAEPRGTLLLRPQTARSEASRQAAPRRPASSIVTPGAASTAHAAGPLTGADAPAAHPARTAFRPASYSARPHRTV